MTCLSGSLLCLPLIKNRTRFIVLNAPWLNTDPLFAVIELELVPRSSNQQCLNLSLMLLVLHNVEGEVDQLVRM
jgi:hypothetical protein